MAFDVCSIVHWLKEPSKHYRHTNAHARCPYSGILNNATVNWIVQLFDMLLISLIIQHVSAPLVTHGTTLKASVTTTAIKCPIPYQIQPICSTDANASQAINGMRNKVNVGKLTIFLLRPYYCWLWVSLSSLFSSQVCAVCSGTWGKLKRNSKKKTKLWKRSRRVSWLRQCSMGVGSTLHHWMKLTCITCPLLATKSAWTIWIKWTWWIPCRHINWQIPLSLNWCLLLWGHRIALQDKLEAFREIRSEGFRHSHRMSDRGFQSWVEYQRPNRHLDLDIPLMPLVLVVFQALIVLLNQ